MKYKKNRLKNSREVPSRYSITVRNCGGIVTYGIRDRPTLKTWCTVNKPKLNSDKSQDLVVFIKLLDFTLDNKLSWLCHISQVQSKLSNLLFFLR